MKTTGLSEKLEATIDGTFHDSADALRRSGDSLGHLAETVTADARNGASQFGALIQKESKHAVSALRATVKERPTLTVGIAAGVGILLGLVIASRR